MARAEVLAFPGRQRRRSANELAFLPAALEIIETPASPLGRAVAATISAFFCVALAWSWWGEIDIVATASGKIIPTGRTKTIQPFEIGVVRAIHVAEGQAVKAGDMLIELDPTTSGAERERLAGELLGVRVDMSRLRAALAAVEASTTIPADAGFTPPAEARPQLVAVHRQLLLNQVGEQRAKLAVLERQEAQRVAERATVAAAVAKLSAAIPLLAQRAEARRYLAEKEYGSKLQYLEVQQDLVEHEHELVLQRSRLIEAEAALAVVRETRKQTVAEFHRAVLGEVAAAEQKGSSLEQELVKAEQRTALQALTAPVDGVVQQLQVHTIGGVVTPAQAVMMIVPADSRLEIEAILQNKDVGFVEVGQLAEIKIETFNFTKYGLVPGTVISVSQDAVARDRPAQSAGPSGQTERPSSAAGAAGDDLVYTARVSLGRTQVDVDGRQANVGPGMAVTVEIKTGARRVIEFALSPIIRHLHESGRER